MQTLPNSYLLEIARQIAFLSAFLGGFAATLLATLLVIDSSRRIGDWIIGAAATAACCFVVSVIASITITSVLHPDVPANVSSRASVTTARIVSTLGFSVGVLALLASVGLSGWLRSRRTGITTSAAALVGLVLVLWALTGFGS